jgi:hypothetical protein
LKLAREWLFKWAVFLISAIRCSALNIPMSLVYHLKIIISILAVMVFIWYISSGDEYDYTWRHPKLASL